MYPLPNLPPRLSREIFAAIRRGLPPAHDAMQDALDARDMIAMAAITALDPRDAAEAMIAAQVVMAEAHGRARLESANDNQHDLRVVMQCRAQARSMMRQAQDSLRGLQRLQATRPIAEPAAMRDLVEEAPPAEPMPGPARASSPAMAPNRTQAGRVNPKPFGSDRPLAWTWRSPQATMDQIMSERLANQDSETNPGHGEAEPSPSHAYGT